MSKGKWHAPEQIVSILKRKEGDLTVVEICRQHGISERTFYRWKAKYDGSAPADVKHPADVMHVEALEDENRRLKQLIGEKELLIQKLRATVPEKH